MPKFTILTGTAAYYISPVTINADNSMSGTVRFGVLVKGEEEGAEMSFHQACEVGQYLSPDESAKVFETVPQAGETLKETLERGFADALKVKGALLH